MRKFCSVHTHSLMCDGKNTLAEMARAACEAGVASFGASGHSHTPIPEDAGCVLPADMTAYRGEVLRLRAERSEERRGGTECTSGCRSRGSPYQ